MLGDFLQAAAADRSPWNCSTMPSDWCVALGHADFAAPWRDIVDPAECEDAPAQAGGLVELWRQGIGDQLPAAIAPFQLGDIAVIGTHGLEAGAIFTGDKWAFRTRRGLSFARLPHEAVVQAWRP